MKENRLYDIMFRIILYTVPYADGDVAAGGGGGGGGGEILEILVLALVEEG